MTIKQKLFNYIFKKEIKTFEKKVEEFKVLEKMTDHRRETFNSQIRSPRYWVDKILTLYGPLDTEAEFSLYTKDIISSPYNDFEEIDTFLNELKSISDNNAFKALIRYLIAEQVVFIARKGESESDNNYARATLNGFLKIDNAIGTLMTERKERQEPEDKEYDEFAVMGE